MKRGRRAPPTQIIRPPLLVNNEAEVLADQRARSREKAVEKRRRDAQFPAPIRTLIDECCRQDPRAKNSTIAKWLRKEHKPLLAEAS